MKDTPPEIEPRYRAMLMQRSGEERLTMGCAMRETARALVEASILNKTRRPPLRLSAKASSFASTVTNSTLSPAQRFSLPSSMDTAHTTKTRMGRS